MPTHPSHLHRDDGPDGTTRTRLPQGSTAAARRPTARPSRTVTTFVGVVVVLIAALAFATRGTNNAGTGRGSSSGDGARNGTPGQAAPTAPTGRRPVTGKTAGIAAGFPKTAQGAQSAAANYAVALGGDGMFRADSRHAIDDAVYTAAASAKLKPSQDSAYSADLLGKLGLDAEGNPPSGTTFVSRTIPVGTKIDRFTTDSATVSVWYLGLIGMAGAGSTDPVHTHWSTWTFTLKWTGSDWKAETDSQRSGPAPIPGDDTAASADAIAKAVTQYGGFTYAR